MKFKILLDSCSDINQELIDKMGVDVIPLQIVGAGDFDRQSEELGCGAFCEYLRTCEKIPTTSQPSPDLFVEYFERYEREGYDCVLFVTMSELGSGTYNSAKLAVSMFEEKKRALKVFVFNSWSTSLAMVLLAQRAQAMLQLNRKIEDILTELNALKKRISGYYLVDNVNFLMKSGRVSAIKAKLATSLNLKPIVQIKEGTAFQAATAMGQKMGIQKLINYFDKLGKKDETVYVTHAANPERAGQLIQALKRQFHQITVCVTESNKQMSIHAGPDSVGIFFEREYE